MKINQYEFLRDGKPFEPTKEEIIQFAEHELAKKDKELKKLQDKLKRTEKAMHQEVKEHLEYYNADQKQLRHQVCEEIKEAFLTELQLPNEEWVWHSDNYAGVSLIKEVLDQVEGENNDN